ncbi:DUF2189 domain-containing protein [Candidatus Thiosymbion oneisti]|uniref:DUF2189 domain-containing protein n=1 Tax=Candidatus Thiosymbion oneisti TaxID=589554 RepID=UPI000B7E782C|nr:DUF2189 domain-containing protein [Candidatus Thiosymbion oneisti]
MSTDRALDPAASALRVTARPFRFSDLVDSLVTGWQIFRTLPAASIAYAGVFALVGLVLLAMIGYLGLSPMALPVSGGFLLVGPALLTGFSRLTAIAAETRKARLSDAFAAFARAPAGLWLVASLCTFLFLIWITDAAVLYALMIGSEHLPYELPWLIRLEPQVVAFELWGSLMGSVLAFIIFAISAFSVPLLHEGRADFVQAVLASVRAVFGNFLTSIAWGLILTGGTLLAILMLPLFVVLFPVLAYASFALYRRVFPFPFDPGSGVMPSGQR